MCVCVGVCVYKTTTTQVFPPLPPVLQRRRRRRAHECVWTEVSEKAACERKNGLPLPSRPPPSSLSCGCVDAMNKKKRRFGCGACV